MSYIFILLFSQYVLVAAGFSLRYLVSAETETKPVDKSNIKEIEETYSANHIKVEFLQEHVKSLYPEAKASINIPYAVNYLLGQLV